MRKRPRKHAHTHESATEALARRPQPLPDMQSGRGRGKRGPAAADGGELLPVSKAFEALVKELDADDNAVPRR